MSIQIVSDGKVVYEFEPVSEVNALISILLCAKFDEDRFVDIAQSVFLPRFLRALITEMDRVNRLGKPQPFMKRRGYKVVLSENDEFVRLFTKRLRRIRRWLVDVDRADSVALSAFIETAFYPYKLNDDAMKFVVRQLKNNGATQ